MTSNEINLNRFQITPDTKVGELLTFYPHLEDVLISLAPPFEKLRNPILKKTVAKVTSLRHASMVGNIQLSLLINKLREAAGLETLVNKEENAFCNDSFEFKPEMIVLEYDAREDIDNGVVPGKKVLNGIKELKENEIYKLITPFTPAPLIDKAREKGYLTCSKKTGEEYFETYFSKSPDSTIQDEVI